jgi:hypothetical protein
MARCGKLMTCSPTDMMKQWGTMSACLARIALACTDELGAADTGATPDGMIACGSAVTAEACSDFLGTGAPAACQFVGPNSGTCAFEAQCSTGYCAIGANAACGLCQAPPTPGTSCAVNSCGPTLLCNTNLNQCVTPTQSGQPCNKNTVCEPGLSCVGATNIQNGTCMPQVTTLGGTCDYQRKIAPTCSAENGLTCNHATNRCVALPLVGAGSPCGVINNVENECTAGATCVIPTNQTQGTCVAPPGDGSACDIKSGPDCFFPARCIPATMTGTAGTCQLPGTQSC